MNFEDKYKITDSFSIGSKEFNFCSLDKLDVLNPKLQVSKMPNAVKIMTESIIRNTSLSGNEEFNLTDLNKWSDFENSEEIPYYPSRVLLQDFTGVPVVVDLASMRDAVKKNNGDPSIVNPMVPVDLVIDHSVQVDFFGTKNAFMGNVEKEYERNSERWLYILQSP